MPVIPDYKKIGALVDRIAAEPEPEKKVALMEELQRLVALASAQIQAVSPKKAS